MAKTTATERAVYHVVPNASGELWVVSRERSNERTEYQTKEEAVEAAQRLAKQADLGQIKVHKKDGNMEYESTYGEDPPETPG